MSSFAAAWAVAWARGAPALRRPRSWVLLVGALMALAPGRGRASPPLPQALSPRELLALSPQVVSALGSAAQARARARLTQALAEQAAAALTPLLLPTDARLAPAVQLPLTPGLQKVLALDLQRRARKQDPVLVAVLVQTALKPLSAPGLLDAPEAAGERSARLLLPAGLMPSAAAALRRVCERAAAQWPTLLEGATVRLVAGVPFAVLLSQPERVVYVNPVVLALVTPAVSPGGSAGALPLDGERLLTYRSTADCAQKVRAGCQACLHGDAAECAAVKATLTNLECRDLDTPRGNLPDLCSERALALPSVAACVARSAPACLQTQRPTDCPETIDRCIANPSAPGPDGASRPSDDPPAGLGCAACTTCGQGCAGSCGECGRQACEPLGEPCSNKAGAACTDSCNDWNRDCNKSCGSCSQASRDCNSTCDSFSSLCTSCSRGCGQNCGQCDTSCNQCNRNCSQCNSDCNQCGSDCNSCNSQCNQCSGDCNSCGNQCGNASCPNQQCSVSEVGIGYPRFPLPPGPADPPSPLARMLVGARGTVAFCLPPLLFLWWRRRLYATRRRPEATG